VVADQLHLDFVSTAFAFTAFAFDILIYSGAFWIILWLVWTLVSGVKARISN